MNNRRLSEGHSWENELLMLTQYCIHGFDADRLQDSKV